MKSFPLDVYKLKRPIWDFATLHIVFVPPLTYPQNSRDLIRGMSRNRSGLKKVLKHAGVVHDSKTIKPRIPESNSGVCPSYIIAWKVKNPLCFIVSCVPTPQQHKSKSTPAIKVATMKNVDHFCYKRNSSTKLFTVSKDELDTKEDTGKPTKNAFYVLHYAERHLLG